MAEPKEKRPLADNPATSQNRFNRIRDGFGQYNKAMENGYYIECVALMDSAITDRLESLYGYLEKPDKYKYWDDSCYKKIKNNPNLSDKIRILIERYKKWSVDRNEAVHGMIKISESDQGEAFEKLYLRMENVANEGYDIFRDLDKAMKEFRKQEEKSNNNLNQTKQ